MKDHRGHGRTNYLIALLYQAQLNRLILFTMLENYDAGSNHIVESIPRNIRDMALWEHFPRLLFIQPDCWNENKKDHHVVYWRADLMERVIGGRWGLLPDWTYSCYIDQTFITTICRLKTHDAIALLNVQVQHSQWCNKNIMVTTMHNFINWSGLCETN